MRCSRAVALARRSTGRKRTCALLLHGRRGCTSGSEVEGVPRASQAAPDITASEVLLEYSPRMQVKLQVLKKLVLKALVRSSQGMGC